MMKMEAKYFRGNALMIMEPCLENRRSLEHAPVDSIGTEFGLGIFLHKRLHAHITTDIAPQFSSCWELDEAPEFWSRGGERWRRRRCL